MEKHFTHDSMAEGPDHKFSMDPATWRDMVERTGDVPRYDAGSGRTKFPAAWLIERAGVTKGMRRGGVAVSSKHTLALVHLGGGSTTALVALAREIRDRVEDEFGVRLEPEPCFVGVAL